MPAFLAAELPVRARTRHHWIVLLRPPPRRTAILLAILLLAAAVRPMPVAVVFGVVVAGLAFLRWRAWSAEWIILTGRRIIRVQGVPETTSSEASLRVDRISGARLVETVPGKVLHYGTIELEAPGDHPGVRRLVKIADPRPFFVELRQVAFGDDTGADPEDDPYSRTTTHGTPVAEYATEPLPVLPHRPLRDGRRRR